MEANSPPISRSHKLQTTSNYYLKVSIVGAVLFLIWSVWKYQDPGPYSPPFDAALKPAIGIFFFGILAAFFAYLGWQARKEFAAMRAGRYFAHWKFEDLERWKLLSGFERGRRKRKIKVIFFIPFVMIGGGGTVLGIIGAFAKSDPMVGVTVSAYALASGAVIGGVIAGLIYMLTGVGARMLELGNREAIFTENGFYIPGFFIPVMTYAKSKRSIEIKENQAHSFLCFTLKVPVRRGNSYNQGEQTVVYSIPIPPGKDEEAVKLAKNYSSDR